MHDLHKVHFVVLLGTSLYQRRGSPYAGRIILSGGSLNGGGGWSVILKGLLYVGDSGDGMWVLFNPFWSVLYISGGFDYFPF